MPPIWVIAGVGEPGQTVNLLQLLNLFESSITHLSCWYSSIGRAHDFYNRIGEYMDLTTKQKGNITELQCITAFYQHGCQVSIPFGDNAK